ncbi:MAG: hypothetical protein AAFX79_03780 [Planctomycetota bacterium]
MIGRAHHRGLTLIEVTISLGITSTVMIGAIAAIGIGGQAFRAAADQSQMSAGADGLARMTADLRLAREFLESNPNSVTFTVPDRTGDGIEDRLRYAWSGTPGDPLTLSMNDATPVAIVDAVDGLGINYVDIRVAGTDRYQAIPVVIEELLFERTDASGSGGVDRIRADEWVGAVVEPDLPADAVACEITRLVFEIEQRGAPDQEMVFQVRPVDGGGLPETTVLAEVRLSESEFAVGDPEPYEVVLPTPVRIAAGDHVAIVMGMYGGGAAGALAIDTSSPEFLADGWLVTGDETSFTINGSQDLVLEVYGVIER